MTVMGVLIGVLIAGMLADIGDRLLRNFALVLVVRHTG